MLGQMEEVHSFELELVGQEYSFGAGLYQMKEERNFELAPH